MLARHEQTEADASERTLGDVLAAAADELRHAYERGLRLEEAILRLLARNPSSDGQELNELQHLDLVLQHVSAVSAFLSALAVTQSATAASGFENALACVTLSDVRQRMLGHDIAAVEDEESWQLLQG